MPGISSHPGAESHYEGVGIAQEEAAVASVLEAPNSRNLFGLFEVVQKFLSFFARQEFEETNN
jgi:hypothetical protein